MAKVGHIMAPAGRNRRPRRTWRADERGTQVMTPKLTTRTSLTQRYLLAPQTEPVIHNVRSEAPKREASDALHLDGLIALVLGSADRVVAQPRMHAQGLSLHDAPSRPGDPYVWTYQGVLDWGATVPQKVLENVSQRTDDLPPMLLSEVRALLEV
jgi:hypothetical protein